MKNKFLILSFLATFLLLNETLWAQKVRQPIERKSPLGLATFLGEDGTYLKVTYGQPRKKGRNIFGELVPYGELWRTGANEATEITITEDIKMNRKNLEAGTYTLFTIPGAKEWTIILNKALGQWGAYKYEEVKDQDALTFTVSVDKSDEVYEAFTIQFEESRKGADLVLNWDQTRIVIPITLLRKK